MLVTFHDFPRRIDVDDPTILTPSSQCIPAFLALAWFHPEISLGHFAARFIRRL